MTIEAHDRLGPSIIPAQPWFALNEAWNMEYMDCPGP